VERELLISDAAGIYIPRNFYEGFDFAAWGLKLEDFPELSHPDNQDYWDAWDRLLDSAQHIDKAGEVWSLDQDGDLFTVTGFQFCECPDHA
jgi:hypothetical protein